MPDTIEGYLARLRSTLAGADPALAQDALYDAEEYLRSATAEGGGTPEAIAAAIEAYGTPDEIATAYRETERTVAAALRRPVPLAPSNPIARFFSVVSDPGAWGALLYMLLALATGVVYFTVVVTGLSLSVGLMVLIIGLPVALLFIGAVRAISLAEGRMVEGLLGVRMPRRPRSVVVADGSFIGRLKAWFSDYRTWTTMLYMVLMLPLGIMYFTTIVTALALSLATFVLPIWQVVAHMPFIFGDYGYYLDWWAIPLVMLAGGVGFIATLWVAKGVGYLHGAFAKALLVGRFEGGEAS